jgi:hypothetical protein
MPAARIKIGIRSKRTKRATATLYFNSRMLNPTSGGSYIDAAANIDVMFVPN